MLTLPNREGRWGQGSGPFKPIPSSSSPGKLAHTNSSSSRKHRPPAPHFPAWSPFVLSPGRGYQLASQRECVRVSHAGDTWAGGQPPVGPPTGGSPFSRPVVRLSAIRSCDRSPQGYRETGMLQSCIIHTGKRGANSLMCKGPTQPPKQGSPPNRGPSILHPVLV